MKAKLGNYNLAKGNLVQMQRKKTYGLWLVTSVIHTNAPEDSGNLSVRSLADVVSKESFIQDSEYLETVLVAVPKYACPVDSIIFMSC